MNTTNSFKINPTTVTALSASIDGVGIERTKMFVRKAMSAYENLVLITGVQNDEHAVKQALLEALKQNDLIKLLQSSSNIVECLRNIFGHSLFQPQSPIYSGLGVFNAVRESKGGKDLSANACALFAAILIDLLDPLKTRSDIRSFSIIAHHDKPEVPSLADITDDLMVNYLFDSMRVKVQQNSKKCPISSKRMAVSSLDEYIISSCADIADSILSASTRRSRYKDVFTLVADLELGIADKHQTLFGDLREHDGLKQLRQNISIAHAALRAYDVNHAIAIPAHELKAEVDAILRNVGRLTHYEECSNAAELFAMSGYRHAQSGVGYSSATVVSRIRNMGGTFFYRELNDPFNKSAGFSEVRNITKERSSLMPSMPDSIFGSAVAALSNTFDLSNAYKKGLQIQLVNVDVEQMILSGCIGRITEFKRVHANDIRVKLESAQNLDIPNFVFSLGSTVDGYGEYVLASTYINVRDTLRNVQNTLDVSTFTFPALNLLELLPEMDTLKDVSYRPRYVSEAVVQSKYFGAWDPTKTTMANTVAMNLPSIADTDLNATQFLMIGSAELLDDLTTVQFGSGFTEIVHVLNDTVAAIKNQGKQQRALRETFQLNVINNILEWYSKDVGAARLLNRAINAYASKQTAVAAPEFLHPSIKGAIAATVFVQFLNVCSKIEVSADAEKILTSTSVATHLGITLAR